MRKFLFVLVALMFAAPVTAQQRTVVTISEPPTSFYKVGKAEVSYWAGTDSNEVRIQLPSHASGSHAASLWFVSVSSGKTPVRPQEVSLGLMFRSEKERLEKLKSFVIKADEEELKIVNETIEGITFELYDRRWARALGGALPFDEFQKLVNSKSAKVRVSDIDFVLDQPSRDALRDMLKALTEPRPKS